MSKTDKVKLSYYMDTKAGEIYANKCPSTENTNNINTTPK